jgi:hypothetical protein
MAAAVTSRICEMGDVVDVLEAWEQARMSRAAWSMKVQDYLERAEYCERMASLVSAYGSTRHLCRTRAAMARLGAPASRPWKSSSTFKLTHYLKPRGGAGLLEPSRRNLVISGAFAAEIERSFA